MEMEITEITINKKKFQYLKTKKEIFFFVFLVLEMVTPLQVVVIFRMYVMIDCGGVGEFTFEDIITRLIK